MSLPSEQVCKGCSLVVQPGYPKCPRCKMPLPKFEAPLATVTKASQVKGGTAIDDESSSGMLVMVGALLVVGVVVGVVLITGDDAKKSADDLELEPAAQVLETPSNARTSNDPQIGISTDPGTLSQDEQRAGAVAELNEALSGARLWATVSWDASADSTVSVVSSACEQEEMQPTLRASAEALKDVGFTTIICVAKHGAPIFELDL